MSNLASFLFRPSRGASFDAALLAMRVVVGLAFLFHGWRKIQNPFGWMGEEATIPAIFQAAAAVSEFGGGFCWILGLFTRVAALGIFSTMVVAASTHIGRGDPFVGRGGSYELALVFATVALVLFFGGPGRFSIDAKLAGRTAAALLLACAASFAPPPGALAAPGAAAASDPAAVALAESTLEAMGGRDAWNAARYLTWRFMGKRLHHWDKATGDVRIEADGTLILMNVVSKTGRAYRDGVEITEPGARAKALEDGYGMWVNDSYWMFMPYKMLDPGVILAGAEASVLADGSPAHKVTMTFESVGITPENKYEVWIADDTKLVEQWAYYESADAAEPKFTLPWGGWKKFGGILLATEHGREADWAVGAPESLPRALFETP